eukprot:Phypoly_transcript_02483.p1 GENE.Phypoly_transcript_02483~~Phypoly_transcript_02483.p1  ORF type:complete len:705 (+),score=143.22 Phypoly_transcript_02483:70-2184(+)
MADPEISKILESYFQAAGSIQRRTTFYQSNWSNGCEAFANKDFNRAIHEFQQGEHSKMIYNSGMAYLCQSAYEPAREAFSRALGKDRFFALGWFQRGYCDYVAGDYPSAFQDFAMAKKLLHENNSIDYGKIGCNFELKKTEILFNIALVHLQIGNLDEAHRSINEGKSIHDKNGKVDFDALRAGKGSCVPFFSQSDVFHPPILANAAKKRSNTNSDKIPSVVVVKDELAEALRQKIKRLEEGDQTQIYNVLSALKRSYGEDILAVKNVPDIAGKEDYLVKQIIDLRDILYNKNVSKTLQRHGRELSKSFDKRAEKWKLWCDMFAEHSAQGREEELVTEFLKSDVIRASIRSICTHTPTDDEHLLLLESFSFLLLSVLKAENVLEFLTAMSPCTVKNEELTKSVVDAVVNLENLTPSASGTDTLAIFPSFFESVELHEKALQCNKLKTSSTILQNMEQAVRKLTQDYAAQHAKYEKEFSEKTKVAEEKITQLDSEIEELRSKLALQANEIQATTSALNAEKVREKAKQDKIELVQNDRLDYLKIRAEEEKKIVAKFELTRIKIESYKKSLSAITVCGKGLQSTLTKLVSKFIPTLTSLISDQEVNIQFLHTKFANYHSSMREFRSEPEIYAKLRNAFLQCARGFRILANNTQILAQSAETLLSVLGSHEWDAARVQVDEAQTRIAALLETEQEMEHQFSISSGGN